MMKREKIAIAVTLIACCVSLMLFAFVSLARFLTSPDKFAIPLVDKLTVSSLSEMASLNSVIIPKPSPATPTPPVAEIPPVKTDEKITPASSPMINNVRRVCNELIESTRQKKSESKRYPASDKAVEKCRDFIEDTKKFEFKSKAQHSPSKRWHW